MSSVRYRYSIKSNMLNSAISPLYYGVEYVAWLEILEEGANIVNIGPLIPEAGDHREVVARLASIGGVNEVNWMTRPALQASDI